jgi:small subunit ribosomal protein S7
MLSQKNRFSSKKLDFAFFFSLVLRKFLSQLMRDGKKSKAEKILKSVFIKISLKGYSPVKTVIFAVNNVKPFAEVRQVRLKGKSFQVPFPIQISRQISSSLKIILSSSKNKKNFEDSLVAELIDSSLNRSSSVKTTLALHKLASQNRLFTYYRWF